MIVVVFFYNAPFSRMFHKLQPRAVFYHKNHDACHVWIRFPVPKLNIISVVANITHLRMYRAYQ